jgi:hypothetical protein
MPSSLSQVVNSSKLVTTTGNKQCEHNLSTAYEQICNNLFAGLEVTWQYYVARFWEASMDNKGSHALSSPNSPFKLVLRHQLDLHPKQTWL